MHRHIIYRDYCCYEQSPAKLCWKSPANLSRRPAPRALSGGWEGVRGSRSRAGRGGGGPGGHPLLLGTLPCPLCAGTGPSLPSLSQRDGHPHTHLLRAPRPRGRSAPQWTRGLEPWHRLPGSLPPPPRSRARDSGAGLGRTLTLPPRGRGCSGPARRTWRDREAGLGGAAGRAPAQLRSRSRTGPGGAEAGRREVRRPAARGPAGGRPGRGAAGMERSESVEAWLDDHRDFAFSYFVRKASR